MGHLRIELLQLFIEASQNKLVFLPKNDYKTTFLMKEIILLKFLFIMLLKANNFKTKNLTDKQRTFFTLIYLILYLIYLNLAKAFVK